MEVTNGSSTGRPTPPPPISVFDYFDYREFLRDFYLSQKRKSRGYSYRVFANKAQLTSPNYLKLVIDGTRKVTEKNRESFARGLSLTKEATKYFFLLVQFDDTEDPRRKRELFSEIMKKRSRRIGSEKLSKDHEEILKSWRHWAIREMVHLSDFRPDGEWMSQRLRRDVSAKQAIESLNLLVKTGLVIIKDGKYSTASPKIATNKDSGYLLRDLNIQMIEKGIKACFRDPRDKREITGLTISVPQNRTEQFMERLRQMRDELNDEFSLADHNDGPSEVYHLQMMFFPLTRTEEKK